MFHLMDLVAEKKGAKENRKQILPSMNNNQTINYVRNINISNHSLCNHKQRTKTTTIKASKFI